MGASAPSGEGAKNLQGQLSDYIYIYIYIHINISIYISIYILTGSVLLGGHRYGRVGPVW